MVTVDAFAFRFLIFFPTVLGTPDRGDWPEAYKLAAAMNFKFPQFSATPLEALVPTASREALLLMTDMLR